MHRYGAKIATVQRIRALDYHTVTTHKIACLKIANVAGEQALARRIDYKLLPVQAKRAASANHVIVTVTILCNVLYHLAVERSCALKLEGVAIRVFIPSEKL